MADRLLLEYVIFKTGRNLGLAERSIKELAATVTELVLPPFLLTVTSPVKKCGSHHALPPASPSEIRCSPHTEHSVMLGCIRLCPLISPTSVTRPQASHSQLGRCRSTRRLLPCHNLWRQQLHQSPPPAAHTSQLPAGRGAREKEDRNSYQKLMPQEFLSSFNLSLK